MKKLIILISTLMLCACSLTPLPKAPDYENGIIGITHTSELEASIESKLPNATYVYYNGYTELANALSAGEIDAFAVEEVASLLYEEEETFVKTDLTLDKLGYGYAFANNDKGAQLHMKMNEHLSQLAVDETIYSLRKQWFNSNVKLSNTSYAGLPTDNGIIKVAASTDSYPMCYLNDGEYVGYEIDILVRFCETYGYGVEFIGCSSSDVLPMLSSGAADMAVACVKMTEENINSYLMSEPTYEGNGVIFTLAEAVENEKKTIESVGILSSSDKELSKDIFADAEFVTYKTPSELIAAYENADVSAVVANEPLVRLMKSTSKGNMPDYRLNNRSYGYMLANDNSSEKLYSQINEYIINLKDNGLLTTLEKVWLSNDDSAKTIINPESLKGKKGTLKAAVLTNNEPFAYENGGILTGLELDILTRFCEEYGYKLELTQVTLEEALFGVTDHTYNLAFGMISDESITVDAYKLTVPHYIGGSAVLISR